MISFPGECSEKGVPLLSLNEKDLSLKQSAEISSMWCVFPITGKLRLLLTVSLTKASFFADRQLKASRFSLSSCYTKTDKYSSCWEFLWIAFFMSRDGFIPVGNGILFMFTKLSYQSANVKYSGVCVNASEARSTALFQSALRTKLIIKTMKVQTSCIYKGLIILVPMAKYRLILKFLLTL